MTLPLSLKQLEFIVNSTAKWNLAHGSVRSGKTIGTLYRFLQAVNSCPDSKIYMVGHSIDTVYRNAIALIFENPEFAIFRPFCTWHKGSSSLTFKDKRIKILGAKDSGSVKSFQGGTWSIGYCDEITLYPDIIIEMIDTRLSAPHSMGIATMNPTFPTHIVKQWIDKGLEGDKNYYSLHFTLDDNPYVDQDYKERIKACSGVFYKRNYLGLWCLAEGAIFDFFDRDFFVVDRQPKAAEYWIAGVDVGTSNAFACVILGINSGKLDQTDVCRWVEKEFYWDWRKHGRQKTHGEYADDLVEFLEPYGVKQVYIDPSAAAFKVELRKRGFAPIDANNEVYDGISYMTTEMEQRRLYIFQNCTNLIREIESYTWDPKASEKGRDLPIKQNDHAIDALRYAVYTHKVAKYNPYKDKPPDDYLNNRFNPGSRRY